MERLRDTEFIDRREIISEIFKEKPKELDNYFVAGIIRCIFINPKFYLFYLFYIFNFLYNLLIFDSSRRGSNITKRDSTTS